MARRSALPTLLSSGLYVLDLGEHDKDSQRAWKHPLATRKLPRIGQATSPLSEKVAKTSMDMPQELTCNRGSSSGPTAEKRLPAFGNTRHVLEPLKVTKHSRAVSSARSADASSKSVPEPGQVSLTPLRPEGKAPSKCPRRKEYQKTSRSCSVPNSPAPFSNSSAPPNSSAPCSRRSTPRSSSSSRKSTPREQTPATESPLPQNGEPRDVAMIRLILADARRRHRERPTFQERLGGQEVEEAEGHETPRFGGCTLWRLRQCRKEILREVMQDVLESVKACSTAASSIKLLKQSAEESSERSTRCRSLMQRQRAKIAAANIFNKRLVDDRVAETEWVQLATALDELR